MSLDILERVKDFLFRLVKDEGFRTQLMSDKIEEIKKVMSENGYNFSQQEFETSVIKILELKESGEFEELTEEELLGAFGGLTTARINRDRIIAQSLYGVIYWPPIGHPKPRPRPKPWPQPQPLYGIVVDPIDPIVQPLYGVIVAE
ncbi:Nif11-like leader peptide family natural product precursor [Nostoc sp. UHCC 0870]|uniref:Nif11-like leader peptide family natural product precursor n=1 Tax=Nostoc sp. UHCC 0870 TaxID=2914041 RepID=UPI001EDD9B6D|nr:Nif11-like leader peptide family natural product precursor [Nostoc sp. UHCC 0870]UKO97451.1 Nif11-like leader peptide family natural product precursor [Nostoc sp. UHCC 0870]